MSAFYKHLDKCRQCYEHPFGLCPIGESLLRQAAAEAIRQAEDRVGRYFAAADQEERDA